MNNILIITLILISALLIAKIIALSNEIKNKRVRLMQFYLDRKFLYNIIVKKEQYVTNQEFLDNFLQNVKIFFQLEDVVITTGEKLPEIIAENDNLNKIICEKILKYYKKKEILLDESNKLYLTFEYDDINYDSYVFFSPDKDKSKNTIIICIKKSNIILSNDEIYTLDILFNFLRTSL
jgi:hypothetical protein